MIENYLLEYLLAFKEHKTLSKAVKQLHVSQPSLSRSMIKIESLFGVKFFDRDKKRLKLNKN